MKVNGTDATTKVNAVEKKQANNLKDWLNSHVDVIKSAIPKGTIDINRFMQSALLAIYDAKQPKLCTCTTMSILKSLKESASLGLEVGGVLGQAYLIPYNEYVNGKQEMTCHFQMGYKGLIALARRSETIKTIASEAVHENDFFECELGMGRKLSHKIDIRKERGPVIAYYCLVELTNGGNQFVVMSKKEVENHRNNFSKAYKGRESDPNNIWNKNFDAMALKTCIIQALKLCPISIEALEAVRKEELSEIDDSEIPTTNIKHEPDQTIENVEYTIQNESENELFDEKGINEAFDQVFD